MISCPPMRITKLHFCKSATKLGQSSDTYKLFEFISSPRTALSFTLQWVLIVDVELPWRGCTMLNRSERNLLYLSPLNYGFGDAVL